MDNIHSFGDGLEDENQPVPDYEEYTGEMADLNPVNNHLTRDTEITINGVYITANIFVGKRSIDPQAFYSNRFVKYNDLTVGIIENVSYANEWLVFLILLDKTPTTGKIANQIKANQVNIEIYDDENAQIEYLVISDKEEK